jgi:hypothetical protein
MSPGEPAADGPSMLVCVYYRVARGDAARAIAVVREFQRTLDAHVALREAQVLLRFGLPPADVSPAPVPHRSSAPLSGTPTPDAAADATTVDADATLMETYRLALPDAAGTVRADAAVRAFLAALEGSAGPLAAVARSPRHVELFAPCAS